jgi:hypothetical protein
VHAVPEHPHADEGELSGEPQVARQHGEGAPDHAT